jgi:hypothetical protein
MPRANVTADAAAAASNHRLPQQINQVRSEDEPQSYESLQQLFICPLSSSLQILPWDQQRKVSRGQEAAAKDYLAALQSNVFCNVICVFRKHHGLPVYLPNVHDISGFHSE